MFVDTDTSGSVKGLLPWAQRDLPFALTWHTPNFQGPQSVLLQNQASARYDSSSLASRSRADSRLPPLSQFFLHNTG